MDRVAGEPFGFGCPLFADELVGREAFEGLQSLPEAVGADEVDHVISQLVVVVVVEAFHGGVLDRPVHPFDLTIRPGVPDPGEPVVDLMLAADAVKDVLEGMNMPVVTGEPDAIIGEHDVKPAGHGGDQVAQEGCRGHFPGLLVRFDESEPGGALDCDEEIQPIVGKTVPRTVF